MGSKRGKQIAPGVYEFKKWTVVRNLTGSYGFPKTAWVVRNPKGDEEGPQWTLGDAIAWIKDLLEVK